jgi:hypothetical protein
MNDKGVRERQQGKVGGGILTLPLPPCSPLSQHWLWFLTCLTTAAGHGSCHQANANNIKFDRPPFDQYSPRDLPPPQRFPYPPTLADASTDPPLVALQSMALPARTPTSALAQMILEGRQQMIMSFPMSAQAETPCTL